MKSAEQMLGCLPGLKGTPTRWPFQPLPGWHDFEHERVLCHPVWQELLDTLRAEEPVLLIGPRSSGKTLTALKVSYELLRKLRFPIIRFFDAQSIFSATGELDSGFANSIRDWASSSTPRLGIVEDVHRVDAAIADFLNLVEPYGATWLFTSRWDIDLPASRLTLRLDRFWLETVVRKMAELASSVKGVALPVPELLSQLEAINEPDLRVVYFVLQSLTKDREIDRSDLIGTILQYVREEYLQDSTAQALLRLAAISQLEIACDIDFFDRFPDELIKEGVVDLTTDMHRHRSLSMDSTLARWLLRTADKHGAGPVSAGKCGVFVVETICQYVESWRENALTLLELLIDQQASTAYEVMKHELAFKAVRDHIRDCPAPSLVKLLQVLSIDRKMLLTNTAGAVDIRTYLANVEGLDFGRTMLQLSLVEIGRSVISELDAKDANFIDRKLAATDDFRVFYSVFLSVRSWPDKLRHLLNSTNFDPALRNLKSLAPLLNCIQLVRAYPEHERLVQAVRKQPMRHLADLARRSALWKTRLLIDYLAADPAWPILSFVKACGTLRASFESANLASVGAFLFTLRRRAVAGGRPELLEAYAMFCEYVVQSFDVCRLVEIEDLRRLFNGLDSKSRQALFARLTSNVRVTGQERSYSMVFSSVINREEMVQVGKFLDVLYCIGQRTEAEQLITMVRPSTWDRWVGVNGDDWSAFLSAAPLFLALREKYALEAIPIDAIRSSVAKFLTRDVEAVSITLRKMGINRSTDLLLATDRLSVDPNKVLFALGQFYAVPASEEIGSVETVLRAIGKLLAYCNRQRTPCPEWLDLALQRWIHGPFVPDAQVCDALNNLIHHLSALGSSLCVGFYRELKKLLESEPALLRNPKLLKDWLWNMLTVEGKEAAANWMFHHLDEYLDSLKRAAGQDLIFLLWNGWLISPPVARESRRVIQRKAQQILKAARLQPWERYSLKSVLDLCGARIRFETTDATEIERLLLTTDNPAVFVLLVRAFKGSDDRPLPSAIVDRAKGVLQAVRNADTRNLFADSLSPSALGAKAS